MNVGDKVQINSKFHGMYHKKTGEIVECISEGYLTGYIRIKFDTPVINKDYKYEIVGDVFQPQELRLIEGRGE